jgi:hypothetical protein
MLRTKGNEILDECGRQLAVVLASNVSRAQAGRWAKLIVESENRIEGVSGTREGAGKDIRSERTQHQRPREAKRERR